MRTLRRFRFTAAAVSLLLALQLLAAPATTQATVSLCATLARPTIVEDAIETSWADYHLVLALLHTLPTVMLSEATCAP